MAGRLAATLVLAAPAPAGGFAVRAVFVAFAGPGFGFAVWRLRGVAVLPAADALPEDFFDLADLTMVAILG